jgi:hypothetical protein
MKKILIFIISTVLFVNVYADDFINQKLNEQDELIDNIELQITNMNQIISSLKLDNLDLTEHVDELEKSNIAMGNEISSLKEINKELHVALNSNKEDTSEVINILGNMTEEISKINKQKELTNKFIQIAIPTTTLPLIVSGAYLYFATDEKDLGKLMMMCGGGLLIGGELVWNGGKFILKIW